MSDEYDARSETPAPDAPATPGASTRVLRVVEDAGRGVAPSVSATDQPSGPGRVRVLVAEAHTTFRRRRSYAVVEDDPSPPPSPD
jgi:hypothetical protein